MKQIFCLSLLLNTLLLGMAWRRSAHPSPIARIPRTEVGMPMKSSHTRSSRLATAALQPATPWNAIESATPAEFIAKLRAVGCPERTIRDVVAFRLCREYRNQWLKIEEDSARSWNYTRNRDPREWREQNHQKSQLRNEMISALESLSNQSWGTVTCNLLGWPEWDDQLALLSTDKRRQIRELDGRYRELQQEEHLDLRRLTGELDAADLARLRELDSQKRAELERVLSPQELEEYLYHQSPAADYVRNHLLPAKSESEFRAMVRAALESEMSDVQDPLPARYGLPDPESADLRQEREKRKAAFDQRLKEVLGEDRVAQQEAETRTEAERDRQRQQERAEQDRRAQLVAAAESVGVNAEDAGRFYQRLKELEPDLDAKFQELEKSLHGTPEEKQKQMEAAVKKELERIAVETIGEKGRAIVEKLGQQGR